jgi:3-phenylpropionate/trans-cinnamate dioxygenase ferredoxin reductase component
MLTAPTCVIVGAGHAAAQLVPSLRQEGWQGRILLIGDEPWLPYNRPPLSKTFLSGAKSVEDLLIRPAEAYAKAGVECLPGRRVIAIDRHLQQVSLDDGRVCHYDKLVLATGASVRRIRVPGASLPGICYLRTIADVENIRQFVATGKRAVIVGGGYIGLEAAAMLRQLGMDVRVLEVTDRVLSRVTAPAVSAFYARVHREQGVEILTGMAVSAFEGRDRVRTVMTTDDKSISTDLVLVGIGVEPEVALAQTCGLAIDNGIAVDAHCLTSDPAIAAVGDCTSFISTLYGRRIRLESVQNAVEQAKVAAAALCGKPREYNAVPWFWSDQYDLKLQIAGLSQGYDQLVLRGNPAEGRRFAAFYLKQGQVIAIDAINRPQDFMFGRRLVGEGTLVDSERLADEQVAIKDLL